ncbi:hypothetical protein [Syntrophorhabdus aromaticivorans]|jgi:hypothetical protein|nr:hypothetical protein [Syntrophorhabdus aromaticivorans]
MKERKSHSLKIARPAGTGVASALTTPCRLESNRDLAGLKQEETGLPI